MKKILLIVNICLIICFKLQAQCIPNNIYADSSFGIWPTTDVNLPTAVQGVSYFSVIDIKTPITLIEASGGDSALTSFDTLGQTFYVGDWEVYDFELVYVDGLPNGISLDCFSTNCIIPGDSLSCAYFSGITNDPVGTYPLNIAVNVNTGGNINIGGFLTIPITTDLYTATGSYQYITGYEIEVSNTTNNNNINNTLEKNLLLSYSSDANFLIVNQPISSNTNVNLYDCSGRLVFSKKIGPNNTNSHIKINKKLKKGFYMVQLNNSNKQLTKKFFVQH